MCVCVCVCVCVCGVCVWCVCVCVVCVSVCLCVCVCVWCVFVCVCVCLHVCVGACVCIYVFFNVTHQFVYYTIETSGSTALLRSYVANKAGNRWKTLSDNLRVEESTRDCFLQNCIGLTNDAIACVLNHWAGGNTEQKATWSVLLTAMKESDMRGEADNLEKKLLEGQ